MEVWSLKMHHFFIGINCPPPPPFYPNNSMYLRIISKYDENKSWFCCMCPFSAYTFVKFMVMWTLVLLADFILEFRLEYLWPCWLFFGSVYTTFHCHGLVRTPRCGIYNSVQSLKKLCAVVTCVLLDFLVF